MQNKNIHEDQAAQLKELLNEVNENEVKVVEEQDIVLRREDDRIDILNLPPRKEVHSQKNSSFRLKINKPFRRFLIVILMLVLFGVGYIWGEELFNLVSNM